MPTNDRVMVEYLWLDANGPITARPTSTLSGAGFTIEANVSDTGVGNSPIMAAEMFIDRVGEDGSGTPLTAVDGVFDSSNEAVRGAIDTVLPGPHVVYIHARDAFDNWGPLNSSILGGSDFHRRRAVRK